MSQLYVAVLAIIVIVLLSVAIFRTTRVKTKADYLVAGRSLPAFVLVLTLLTSWIGAGSLFAGAENAYKNGFAALWQPAGGWLGLLLIYFIAPRARKFAQFTLPDLLEARYNQTARVLGTFAILFAYVGITSYQFKGGGDVLHLIFPDTSPRNLAPTSSRSLSSSPLRSRVCHRWRTWMWPLALWSPSSALSPRLIYSFRPGDGRACIPFSRHSISRCSATIGFPNGANNRLPWV